MNLALSLVVDRTGLGIGVLALGLGCTSPSSLLVAISGDSKKRDGSMLGLGRAASRGPLVAR